MFQMIIYLLKSKYMLVKVELDLFVGNVYTQLLKGVLFKVLKAEDIENAHGHAALCCTI